MPSGHGSSKRKRTHRIRRKKRNENKRKDLSIGKLYSTSGLVGDTSKQPHVRIIVAPADKVVPLQVKSHEEVPAVILTSVQSKLITSLIEKHGDDFTAMSRDAKLNPMLKSASALRKLFKRAEKKANPTLSRDPKAQLTQVVKPSLPKGMNEPVETMSVADAIRLVAEQKTQKKK
eukprot:gnl/Dysnectes_brevis/1035_a1155_4115.p1 GENE.gnl/Dysnectes_brevis/1035_a1155_4115~~gnl/Dysnectes_brevis/1035_a1155_4115.p1  ORF type:complete len:175 (-),score=20.21 gnl/Dysnectes_brevis/1035_a1155_4115:31-555(-)